MPATIGSVSCFSQQYPFVYYTPKEGLINGRVKTIKQDSKGRIYFLTYGGLSVYDGAKFTNYNRQNGLADEVINDIAEIAPDTMLVSSNTQKLNTLMNGKIGIYNTADNFYPIINRFLKSSNGQWYIIADEGLFAFTNKKFTRLPLFFNGIDLGKNLDHIIEWENYFLIVPWATQWNTGVLLYDRNKQIVTDTLSNSRGFRIFLDNKKRIWVTTPSGFQFLNTKSIRAGRLELSPLPNAIAPINAEGAGIHFDNAGNAWFFSGNHLQKISSGMQSESISFSEGIKGGINSVFQDREGIIWLALDGAGAIKLKSTGIQLFHTFLPGQQMFFSSIDQQGYTLWCFNRMDNCVYRLTTAGIKKFPIKQKLSVYSLTAGRNKIFLGDNTHLFLAKDKNDPASYLHLETAYHSKTDMLGNSITDSFGAVLQLLQRDDSIHYLSVIKNKQIIFEWRLNYMVDQLTIDHKGKLWLASRNNQIQVYKIDPLNPSKYLQLENEFHKDLPVMNPRCIAVDKQNHVWIGSRYNGLYQFKYDGSSLKLINQYTTKEGLTDNFIYTLSCGINNTIWIGTQTGLDKIFLKNGKYFIANPGKNNTIFQSVFKIRTNKDGTTWAMHNDGSLIKILSETTRLSYTPPLLLTSIKVNDSLFSPASHKFSYKQSNFSFSVAATSFLDERSIRYSYFLEGSGNPHWSEPSNISTFNFIHLTPGVYMLHVMADFPEEKYSSQTISYSFAILPAWWQTWWFRSAFGLFLIAISVFAIRHYYKRKLEKQKIFLEKQQAIEKERTRIATDMHDDLGAGLSRIKFLSETIGIKKQQEQPIEEEIYKIREYSHEMIDKMGEIVWALNERNDSLSDLLTYTRAYAMEYLSQNGIQCIFNMPSSSESYFLSGEFRRNIFLSVKEVLHNIIKHARASQVIILIETEKELRIKISDNGVGFNPIAIRQFSNGLHNIDKRMKDINGRAEVSSTEGTSVSLIAPLPH